MSAHLLTIGGGDRNVRQAPTEPVPINAVISHARGLVPHSPDLIERPRAMRIPSVGAKANLNLRPIARPWTKTQAGKRL